MPRRPTPSALPFGDDEPTLVEEPEASSDEEDTLPHAPPLQAALEKARSTARAKKAAKASERPKRRHSRTRIAAVAQELSSDRKKTQEVAQVFPVRGAVAPEPLLFALDRAVEGVQVQKLKYEQLLASFKLELMPLLRQALALAGGDGLDAYLDRCVAPPGRPAKSLLLGELAGHLQRVNRAKERAVLVAEAKRLVGCVRRHLQRPSRKGLSLRVLEQAFGDTLDVDSLLALLFASDSELSKRNVEVERLLETLRQQLRGNTGKFPESLFRNFSRLKVEKRLIDAEQQRRQQRRTRTRG